MKPYEIMILFDSKENEEELQDYLNKLILQVSNQSSETQTEIDVWGRRNLAYEINKHRTAIYVVINLRLKPEEAKELTRLLDINESVIRLKLFNL